ncbi:MAG: ABC transporter substrate-binding protein [Xanthobacteraceae bacterium]|nr:ABC transporter substrate-binding protein [Xanthobacteraceae bacterium]
MRIGVHPNNLHLTLAQHWPKAFADVDAEFVPYGEGRDTGPLLKRGQIDLGGTGSTPPLAAQVGGLDVQYIAASAPRPANGAILVAKGSSIRTIRDLRGCRIALLDGSFHTYLLAKVLEADGLLLKDVTRVELAPLPSAKALAQGEVGAWIAMAPHLDQALAAGTAEMLAPCGSTIPNRSLFWTLRRRALTPAVVGAFVTELARIGREITAAPERAARILVDAKLGGVDFETWRRALASRDWTIVAADASLIAEQQAEADTLYRHGDMPRIEIVAAGQSAAASAA